MTEWFAAQLGAEQPTSLGVNGPGGEQRDRAVQDVPATDQHRRSAGRGWQVGRLLGAEHHRLQLLDDALHPHAEDPLGRPRDGLGEGGEVRADGGVARVDVGLGQRERRLLRPGARTAHAAEQQELAAWLAAQGGGQCVVGDHVADLEGAERRLDDAGEELVGGPIALAEGRRLGRAPHDRRARPAPALDQAARSSASASRMVKRLAPNRPPPAHRPLDHRTDDSEHPHAHPSCRP